MTIQAMPNSTVSDTSGVEIRYGSHSEATPKATNTPMTDRLTTFPSGQRWGSSRKVRVNWFMPINARQIDSGTDLSASQGQFGHRYSKPRPFSVNSTIPNAVMWNRYQK